LKPHTHDEACRQRARETGVACGREWDVDPWSDTGIHRIRAPRPNPVYGKRPGDLPRSVGWRNWLLKKSGTAAFDLLKIGGGLWLASRFGIDKKGGP
jgi:hypothetical protein